MSSAPSLSQPPTPTTAPPPLPLLARVTVFIRLFAIQASWNYELLVGNGIAFCVEPALRHLPGGPGGVAYRDALAREARYFNAHPYLAAVAVGSLARAELEQQEPARIERFRTALCGPLGSVGDRLVWAGWLPFCSLVALLAFALGASGLLVVGLFLGLYNAGHVALRAWGIHAGFTEGTRVASVLGNPVLRRGPLWVSRAVALLAGLVVPLVAYRVLAPGFTAAGGPIPVTLSDSPALDVELTVLAVLAVAILEAVLLVRLHGRVHGWKVALLVLSLLSIYSVVR